MSISEREAMRESLLEDVQTEIEMAREGQIPPSWQHDRLQDLKQAAAAHDFTPAWVIEQQCRAWCPPSYISTREEAFGYALAMLQGCIPE